MAAKFNWNIQLENVQDRLPLLQMLMTQKYSKPFEWLLQAHVQIVSQKTILKYIDEELIHDKLDIRLRHDQMLHDMSSGERKKAFLDYSLSLSPTVLILDHFFDNIDQTSKKYYREILEKKSLEISIINIYTRDGDALQFLDKKLLFTDQSLVINTSTPSKPAKPQLSPAKLPAALHAQPTVGDTLVAFHNVCVSYRDHPILLNISWKIEKGQFWHLFGPNGSGKTTLLTMITGDNPKAYGQDIQLFGRPKGSGESIWEIKEKVGYFTTNMTFQFKRQQTAREMIISGFFDSIGLYQKAGDQQMQLADEWLYFIDLSAYSNTYFTKLSLCHQRMIMIARAMVKHPPLLILDEPSVDLDEASAALMSELINRIANEGNTTIIYVSHRVEQGLTPSHSFELIPSQLGAQGHTMSH